MNPSEESQVQASYDIVQQDLHNYLFQQFLFPSTFLLRPPDQNQAPPPQPLSAIFPLPPTEQQQLEEFRRFIRPGASNAPPSNRQDLENRKITWKALDGDVNLSPVCQIFRNVRRKFREN